MITPNDQSRMLAPIVLTPAQRNHIAPRFDVVAVERIANLLNEEERRAFLAAFGGVPGEAQVARPGKPQETFILTSHSDPKVQALLEQMWAPYWDNLPPEAIDDPNYHFPGRQIAKERRQARKTLEAPK